MVASNGSRKMFREQNVEMAHIAPQVGTILTAHNLEKQGLRLYKLEHLETEWKRLSKDSGFTKLIDAFKPQFLGHHKSSNDPFNTTYIAKLYFQEYLDSNDSTWFVNHSLLGVIPNLKPNAFYLRAICRIYLIDFICGNYTLPDICSDLKSEYIQIINNYNENIILKSSKYKIFDESTVFYTLFKKVIGFICLFYRSPECSNNFLNFYSEEEEEI